MERKDAILELTKILLTEEDIMTKRLDKLKNLIVANLSATPPWLFTWMSETMEEMLRASGNIDELRKEISQRREKQ